MHVTEVVYKMLNDDLFIPILVDRHQRVILFGSKLLHSDILAKNVLNVQQNTIIHTLLLN